MTGYELVHKLRKTRKRYPLTATEQALFHELVAICNDEEWPDTFNCSNDELCSALKISENTLVSARNTLLQSGLIAYKSGKSKRQYGIYSLATTSKSEVNTGTNASANTGTNASANTGTNAADYIKTKKERKIKTSSASKEAGGSGKNQDFKKEGKGEGVSSGGAKNPTYTGCIALYDAFVKKLTDNGAQIDKAQGSAMKGIISYLHTQVINRNEKNKEENPDKYIVDMGAIDVTKAILASWRLILDNYHLWTAWQQTRTKLTDIKSELQNILKQIKDGIGDKNKSGSTGNNQAKTGGKASAAGRGGSINDLEGLKRDGDTGDPQRIEFIDVEIIEP